MSSKKIILLLSVMTALVVSSCKKELVGNREMKDVKALKVEPLTFNYLTTRSKIRFQNEDSDVSLTASIRIKKDSVIWLSLSPAFGIEAARGLITRDSLVLMNRLNREYFVYDFKTLSEKFNFNIDFDLIQAMLLGDMPIEQNLSDKISQKDGHFIIHQESGNVLIDNYIDAANMKTERIQLYEQPSNNTLTLLYGNFQPFTDTLIPYSNKIILNYEDNRKKRLTTLVDIDHGRAEIADTSLEFPFNIPQKYERK